MRVLSLFSAALVSAVLATSPAIAAEMTDDITLPNPWVAGGLSVTTPLMLGSATLSAFGIGAPVGFGAGHVYAGDPGRGIWVGLGGASAMLAAGAYGMYGPTDDPRPRRGLMALSNVAYAAAVYALFSGWDAYRTAEHTAAQARPAQ